MQFIASLLAIVLFKNPLPVRYIDEYNRHNYPIVASAEIAPYTPHIINKSQSPFLVSEDNKTVLGIGFNSAIIFFAHKDFFSKHFIAHLARQGYQTITFAQ